MSRDSQNFYKHRMDAEPDAEDSVRYSLTFRSIHWANFNSTHVVGDSNFGRVKFGEGRGKVGKSTPGEVAWAAKVQNIDPLKCTSFQNIIVMCGTNNLKEESISSEDILSRYINATRASLSRFDYSIRNAISLYARYCPLDVIILIPKLMRSIDCYMTT